MKKIKLIIILTTVSLIFGCNQRKNLNNEKVEIHIDSMGLKIVKKNKKSNSELISFLENPIDLIDYKNQKKNWTSSGFNGFSYYYSPQKRDSIYYAYTYPNDNENPMRFDKIIVFKYGENKQIYNDNTERLIGMNIFSNDSLLGKANLIGLTTSRIKSRFGESELSTSDKLIYINENKIILLKIENNKVASFKYLKLNTNNIDKELIEQIEN